MRPAHIRPLCTAAQGVRLSLSEVEKLCVDTLKANGLRLEESVDAVAATITAAERDGCKSHGAYGRLHMCMRACVVRA